MPENTTDFIFTVIGEEFGLIGGVGTILLYGVLIAFCLYLSTQVKQLFLALIDFGYYHDLCFICLYKPRHGDGIDTRGRRAFAAD